jgi:hypothetical protein
MVQKLAYTVKMHIPDDPIFMKNSILHLAIWDSQKPFLHEKEN